METVVLLNATESEPGARFTTADIKDFFLMSDLERLANTSLIHTFLSKFFHGSMSSKINAPVGKFSYRYSQLQQQQQQQQQHPGGGPVPFVGQLTDRASGEPGQEPTLQQQQPIVGRRSILPLDCPDRH
jgi:hypothetical protein